MSHTDVEELHQLITAAREVAARDWQEQDLDANEDERDLLWAALNAALTRWPELRDSHWNKADPGSPTGRQAAAEDQSSAAR